MATSKTLTPTNVTIQIPAFTDKPDQRVNSNCIDKEADAINALSDQIANMSTYEMDIDATTDSYGDLNVTIDSSEYVPVSFILATPTNTLIFYVFGVFNTRYYMKLLDDSMSPKGNTAITGKLYYRKR